MNHKTQLKIYKFLCVIIFKINLEIGKIVSSQIVKVEQELIKN